MYAFDITRTVATEQSLGPSQTGRIRAAGVVEVSFGPAVSMETGSTLYVNGIARVQDLWAVRAEGAGSSIENRETGLIHSTYVYAVYFQGVQDFSIRNAGTFEGGTSGVFVSGDSGAVINSGLITGAVAIDSFHPDSAVLTIENAGLIEGSAVGVRHQGGALDIANAGTIRTTGVGADAFAIFGSSGDGIVTNDGRIDGRTQFRAGGNTFDGRDGVQGAVIGAEGDDRILGGLRADEIFGGSGGDDRLYGGGGRDLIYAGTGEGDRRLYGGGDSDKLYGGDGADILVGHWGNDVLTAGAGGDTLFGGSNGDRLIAGAGRDFLNGGEGSDRFVFTTSAAAGRGTTRDVIEDFTPNHDVIDVSAIAGRARFDYIGSAPFTGERWELRYDRATGLVEADTTGADRANFQIELAGSPRLDADDFIL